MSKVLVVEDEPNLRKVLGALLRREGYEVALAEDGEQGIAEFERSGPQVVITDLVMPKVGGMDLLKSINARDPDVPVIIITAHGTVDSAVEAIKLGAFDYITKPFDQAELQAVIAKAARTHAIAQKAVKSDGRLRAAIVGESAQMQEIFRIIDKVANTPSTVLITGESGTGKELVARALHDFGKRRSGPFVAINMAAIPRELIESELFGHVKGAFTGAHRDRRGAFDLAQRGTLFLDEIGEMPLPLQSKLLRVIEDKRLTPIGSDRVLEVDVRFIATTNKDLQAEVDRGTFRRDLFYRLSVMPVRVPPLRERRDDIPLLVDHFVRKYAMQMNRRITRVAPAAMNAIQQHDWPGNVRELENAVERAMVVAREPELREVDFSVRTASAPSPVEAKTLDEMEKAHILRVLEDCGFNQTRTASVLGIDRVTLHNKLKKYGWSRTLAGAS